MGDGAMGPGGVGWAATVRMRVLHTTMRQRLLEESRREWETKSFSLYNEKLDGIPISQEDMGSTLNSFTSAPLLCMVKTGLAPFHRNARTGQHCGGSLDTTWVGRRVSFLLSLTHSTFAVPFLTST